MIGYAIIAGYALDLALGDPQDKYHPVRWIGLLIENLEKVYRRLFKNELAGGAALLFTTALSVYLFALLLISLAASMHPALVFAAHALMVYYAVSIKSLGGAAMSVKEALDTDDVETARLKVVNMVGRDTENMNESEITRAAVESVAEGSVDGIISVLFFAAIGGGPLALAYKAVSSCDSMVGYRNEKYEQFGKFSARADDAANFIPARISVVLIYLAAFIMGMDFKNCLKIAMRDRLKHPSPNSAHPEAAFAGALEIRLGGAASYQGLPSKKPFLGEPLNELAPHHIADAVRLMRVTSLIACGLFVLPLF
ncbi:MAG: adenosylcobinamide-phosphate synthase CbiB [Nitrospinota bacterium]